MILSLILILYRTRIVISISACMTPLILVDVFQLKPNHVRYRLNNLPRPQDPIKDTWTRRTDPNFTNSKLIYSNRTSAILHQRTRKPGTTAVMKGIYMVKYELKMDADIFDRRTLVSKCVTFGILLWNSGALMNIMVLFEYTT